MFLKKAKSNRQWWKVVYNHISFMNTVLILSFCCIAHLYANPKMPKFKNLEPFNYQVGGEQFKTFKDDDLYCVMHFVDWDIDGDLDMFLIASRLSGAIRFYENIGTKSGHHFSDTYKFLEANGKSITLPSDC